MNLINYDFIFYKKLCSMKRMLKMMALALLIMAGSSFQNNASAQYRDDVSYQTFYDQLSPYGNWIEYPDYGYVWQPNMGNDFRPYSSGGHWVWSDDYEWVWVSDYDWGWAPFHYGRWFSDAHYGWLWVPGYEWSSAWVAWRDGGDYYGWAPLRPGINVGINFSIGSYAPPDDYWCFTPRQYITSYNIYDHCIDRRNNFGILRNTSIINNFNYGRNGFVTGPRRFDAERYTGRINPVQFRESNRPGRSDFRNNEVSMYRPNVQRNDEGRFTPNRFDRYDRNNDNRIARNDNDGRRNNTINDRTGNFPDRQQRTDNAPEYNRDNNNNNNIRIPQNNTGNNNLPAERRRFDRTDNNGNNNNRQPDRTDDRRMNSPNQRPDINPSGNNDRRFDRNNSNRDVPVNQPGRDVSNDRPQRQPQQQMEQRRQPEQPRQSDRRDNGNQSPNNGGGDRNNSGRRRF